MEVYKFYYPIQVRYSDLDTFCHVNNARMVSYFESARMAYIQNLGVWDGKSFFDLELIVADVHVTYVKPILLGQNIRVGCRVSRIGNKSLDFIYQVEDTDSGEVLATATTVMVAFSYDTHTSIPVKEEWRRKISQFEEFGISEEKQ